SSGESAQGIALQADNKIVVAGRVVFDFGLARYNPDGSLDTTFGSGGKVVTNIVGNGKQESSDSCAAVALQADGKILAGGSAVTGSGGNIGYSFAVVRYNTNGSLDTSFDTDGKVTTTFGKGIDAVATSLVVQPNGKIVVAGFKQSGSGNDFVKDMAVVRYNT